ncbi:MAG TPA: TldD/PmbA family protein [Firmicutes bacterium]|nr:TldD/PmbA family protein [Bacillota bacterium]
MLFEAFKEAVIAAAKQAGIEEYELYSVEDNQSQVSTYRQEIDSFSSTVSGGVCFRCIRNGRMGYAATELLTEEQAGEIVRRAAANADLIENDDQTCIYAGGTEYGKKETGSVSVPGSDALVDFALRCQKAAYGVDPRVADGTSSTAIATASTVRIYNSKGLDLENTSAFSAAYIESVVEEANEKYSGWSFRVGALQDDILQELAEEAVQKAVSSIGADTAESGTYTVVFSGEQMYTLLSAFAPVFSAENTQKGLSLLDGKEGETIAADCVTLVDDPFYPGSPVQTPFDAEGAATRRKNVIEQGVLRTLLHNLKTAHKANIQTTGNASKYSYASNISVSPYSFYFAPGGQSLEELFAQAGEGIYITEIKGTHAGANPVTGDFSLESSGFLIEEGKRGRPVRSFTIAGNFFTLLKQIAAVGNDLVFDIPSGYTVYGSPSVLAEGIAVAGK